MAKRWQQSLRVVYVCPDRFFSIQSRKSEIRSPAVKPFEWLAASFSARIFTWSLKSFLASEYDRASTLPK